MTAVRIVHCVNYRSRYPGSFVPMLVAAAKAADTVGYETTICLGEGAAHRDWLNELDGLADLRFINPSGLRRNVQMLRSILSEQSAPTIVHAHFGDYDEAAAVVRRFRPQTALVWHAHSGRNRPLKWRSQVYGAVLGRLVDAVLCVSDEIYATASAQRVPRSRLVRFPNAIDLGRFTPISTEERETARRSLELPSDARVVLHFGWDWEIKGGERMLALADRLAGEARVLFVTVLGEDRSGVPSQALDERRNVIALGPTPEVNRLYAAADVYLNTSTAEGMPFAVLEALARGLPVVASDPPVQRSLIEGLPGARISTPELDPMAEALRDVFGLSQPVRDAHAVAARSRIAERYSLEAWSRRLLAVYERILSPMLPGASTV